MGQTDQAAVIDFLSQGKTFGVDKVGRTTTSISEIFFAGDEVYKLKRALTLPYLDFSTLEKRRWACEREVELNRRTAPELYLGVVPVTRQPTGLALGGDGEAIDYLVHMRRFDEDTLFDRLADRDKIDQHLCEALAEVVAAFHKDIPARPDFGGSEGLRDSFEGVIEACFASPNLAPFQDILSETRDRWIQAWERLARRLDIRRSHGYVRQCHGDLHLANICLLGGRPTPFDCIEFNDSIACVDIAYDAAFPVMDFLAHDRGLLANLLFNRYLALAQDYHALPAWPLFLALRALIRGMVNLLEIRDDPRHRRQAETYFGLARRCLAPRQPRLIAIGGRSGTGKSTLARHLAPLVAPPLGAVWLRTDLIRKMLMGVPPEQKLGQDGYRPEVTKATYRRMTRTALRALKSGWPVILDGVYLKPEERAKAEAIAQAAGVPFDGIWLETPLAVRIERAEWRGRDASDADAAVVRMQDEIEAGPMTWNVMDVDIDGEFDRKLKAARALLKI